MGSNNPQEEFVVLVTGFGPFKADYPINPSWEIASRLPTLLPPLSAKSKVAAAGGRTAALPLPPVRIIVHPEPIRVNYQVVRTLVPQLWDGEEEPQQPPPGDGGGDGDGDDDGGEAGEGEGNESLSAKQQQEKPKIDAAIHIGMAGPRLFYSIERRGHRDGYAMKDVDGEFLRDQDRRLREGKDWVWDGAPQELLTDLDVEDVLERWKGFSPDNSDLRISEDAGRFLCDFIYFSSLAHLFKAGERRRVTFLHVPSDGSEANIAIGKELMLNLIRAVTESELVRRGTIPGHEDELKKRGVHVKGRRDLGQ